MRIKDKYFNRDDHHNYERSLDIINDLIYKEINFSALDKKIEREVMSIN